MKQTTLDKIYLMPKLFVSVLMALSLSVFSMLAVAAQQDVDQTTRDFNHARTGFPLTGLHTATECGTCHVGGVFKGTPRNCSGCHSQGMRVVATPKSARHLVTTEPCEVCHSNTVTFYGAKYNHGKAVSGQCTTCHNAVVATGKPSNHSTGLKATKSCDNCHRTFAWLPSTFNHTGVAPGTCKTCHNGSSATGKPAATHASGIRATDSCDSCHRTSGWFPAYYNHASVVPGTCATCHNGNPLTGKSASHTTTAKATYACDSCHTTIAWLPAAYKHNGATTGCSTCHNGTFAVGKNAGHIATTLSCESCHSSTSTWLGALGAAPSNHSALNTASGCSTCHVGAATTHITGAALHSFITSTCYTCHGSNRSVIFNSVRGTASWPSFHESSKNPAAADCSASGCHAPAGNKGSAYTTWH